jgi:hypothetical protein
MATKEKMVDLKAKPTKISDEHLESLQKVVNKNNAVQFQIGGLEAQKHELLHQRAQIQQEIIGMQDTLSQEYGTFDVNLKDGTINYSEDGEPRD